MTIFWTCAVLFLFFWIAKLKRQFILSLVVLIIGIDSLRSFINFSNNSRFLGGNEISIISYNVRLFNIYKWIEEDNVNIKIRDFLKIKNFFIIGGSWGATLALKYALKYPKNISAILLRSVFLGTMNEIDWAFINGPKIFAPKLFEIFSNTAENAEDLISKYYDEICVKNSKVHSWIWHDYERILSQINPDNSMFDEKKKIEESFKNGKRDGLSTSWYENGQKVSQGTFIAGKLNGVSTGWYKNGKKWLEITYDNGQGILRKEWNKDGTTKTK